MTKPRSIDSRLQLIPKVLGDSRAQKIGQAAHQEVQGTGQASECSQQLHYRLLPGSNRPTYVAQMSLIVDVDHLHHIAQARDAEKRMPTNSLKILRRKSSQRSRSSSLGASGTIPEAPPNSIARTGFAPWH